MKSSTRIVAIHGINVFTPAYARDLCIAAGQVPVIPIVWGGMVRPTVEDYKRRVARTYGRTWSPIKAIGRRIIREAQELAFWTQAYRVGSIRGRLIDEAAAMIRREVGRDGRDFIFVGHSLGSVILTDLVYRLVETGELHRGQVWAIVTMGSPLHVWLPPDLLSDTLRTIPVCNRWVNLWDADDLVAAPLHGIDNRIIDREINTGSLFDSHGGYWSDREAIEAIMSCVGRA